MSTSHKVADPDPERWPDPAATYDTLATDYADLFLDELKHKPFDSDLLNRFAQTVGARADAAHPVWDIGCGPGHVGAFVAAIGPPVEGIDLSAGMVAEARRRFPALTFSQGDMTSLDRVDVSLAGIVCFYALIHIPRSRVPTVLREMRRVLVDGGPLLLSVHGGEDTLHATEMVGRPADLDATLFALPELTGLVQDAGFEIVEAHERAPYEGEHPTPRLYVWARS
jgi:SAM-dependent methyltransferase